MIQQYTAVIGPHQAYRDFERGHAMNIEWHRPDSFKSGENGEIFLWVGHPEAALGIEFNRALIVGPGDGDEVKTYDAIRHRIEARA